MNDLNELRAWAEQSARELSDREWGVVVRADEASRAAFETMMAVVARHHEVNADHLQALRAYLDEMWAALDLTQRAELTASVDKVCAELPPADAEGLIAKHLVEPPIGTRGGNVIVPSSALGRAVVLRARSRATGPSRPA